MRLTAVSILLLLLLAAFPGGSLGQSSFSNPPQSSLPTDEWLSDWLGTHWDWWQTRPLPQHARELLDIFKGHKDRHQEFVRQKQEEAGGRMDLLYQRFRNLLSVHDFAGSLDECRQQHHEYLRGSIAEHRDALLRKKAEIEAYLDEALPTNGRLATWLGTHWDWWQTRPLPQHARELLDIVIEHKDRHQEFVRQKHEELGDRIDQLHQRVCDLLTSDSARVFDEGLQEHQEHFGGFVAEHRDILLRKKGEIEACLDGGLEQLQNVLPLDEIGGCAEVWSHHHSGTVEQLWNDVFAELPQVLPSSKLPANELFIARALDLLPDEDGTVHDLVTITEGLIGGAGMDLLPDPHTLLSSPGEEQPSPPISAVDIGQHLLTTSAAAFGDSLLLGATGSDQQARPLGMSTDSALLSEGLWSDDRGAAPAASFQAAALMGPEAPCCDPAAASSVPEPGAFVVWSLLCAAGFTAAKRRRRGEMYRDYPAS